jgi:hypothetical protein
MIAEARKAQLERLEKSFFDDGSFVEPGEGDDCDLTLD